jgi:hypothetical protein
MLDRSVADGRNGKSRVERVAGSWRRHSGCPIGATFSQRCLGKSVVSFRLTLDAFCKESVAIERTGVPSCVGRNGLNLNGSLLAPADCGNNRHAELGSIQFWGCVGYVLLIVWNPIREKAGPGYDSSRRLGNVQSALTGWKVNERYRARSDNPQFGVDNDRRHG